MVVHSMYKHLNKMIYNLFKNQGKRVLAKTKPGKTTQIYQNIKYK